MKRLLVGTAITGSVCMLLLAPGARAGSGTDAFIGGALGGAVGSVIGNALTRPSPPPAPQPAQREIIYIDREPEPRPERVYRAPAYRAPVHNLTRADIVELQHLLNRYGAVHGFRAGAPDGAYGPTTRRAIVEFQSLRGLPATGLPTYALMAEARRAVQELDAARAYRPEPGMIPVDQRQPVQPTPQQAPQQTPTSVETQRIEVNVIAPQPQAPIVMMQPMQQAPAAIPPAAMPPGMQQATALSPQATVQAAPQPLQRQAVAVESRTASLTTADGGRATATEQRVMLATAGGRAAPAAFDVSGARLGAGRDAAREAVRAFSPTVRFDTVTAAAPGGDPSRAEYVSRIVATLADDGGRSDRTEIWFGPDPNEDAAEFIVRRVRFAEGGRPSLAQIERSLTDKYGPAHAVGDGGDGDDRTLAWIFDPSGAAAPQVADVCVANVGDGLLSQPGEPARDRCGLVAVADISSRDGVVGGLTLRVRDIADWFESRDRRLKIREAGIGVGIMPLVSPPQAPPAVQPVKF